MAGGWRGVVLGFLLAAGPAARAADWANMPWGLATVWFDLPKVSVFNQLAIDIEVKRGPSPAQHLYISAPGQGWLNDIPYYAGIQSAGNTPKGVDRIAIFSRWNETDPAALRPDSGGYGAIASDEGQYATLRRPVPWREGRYRMSLTAIEKDADANWIAAELDDLDSGASWPLGALRFEGNGLTFRNSIATFVEAFGPTIAPADIPHADVVLGPIRINGARITPAHAEAIYHPDVPPTSLARRDPDGTVEIETGLASARPKLPVDAGGHPYQDFYWP